MSTRPPSPARRPRPSEPSRLENAKRAKDLRPRVTGRSPGSPAAFLAAHPEVVLAIARGGTVPAWARLCVVEILQRSMTEARRHREHAAAMSGIRSERIRAGILRAAGVYPLDDPGTAQLIRKRIERKEPGTFGLLKVPDLRTIRRAIKKMDVPTLECGARVVASPDQPNPLR